MSAFNVGELVFRFHKPICGRITQYKVYQVIEPPDEFGFQDREKVIWIIGDDGLPDWFEAQYFQQVVVTSTAPLPDEIFNYKININL